MLSPRATTTDTAAGAGETIRYLQFIAFCLKHAILETQAGLTLEEGLYCAYKRYLRPLDKLGGVPDDLQAPIESLLGELGRAFGLDSSGAKVAGSAIRHDDADVIVTRMNAIAARVWEAIARRDH